MITANTPILLTKEAQTSVVKYLGAARSVQNSTHNLRDHFRNLDLAYQREQDLSTEGARAKIANRYGDPTKLQNVTVPLVMPQVETAVTYQASVFLSGSPLFGIVASPENMDAAMQMETVIDNQAIRGAWTSELINVFRDAYKYNFYGLECAWNKIITAELETDVKFSTTEARPKRVVWEGNTLKRLDPYNMIFDSRVAPNKLHIDAEFIGYTELYSRVKLKSYLAGLDGKIIGNVTEALESGVASASGFSDSRNSAYYVPDINPALNFQRSQAGNEFNWLAWFNPGEGSNPKIEYKNSYYVTTLYARILPSDFKIRVPESNTPQIWKFVYVNDSVLVLAERQTNAHNYLPILCGQGLQDGLGYQTKSLAANAEPLQQLSSGFYNAAIASMRRSVTDRVLYDPSRVSREHINSDNAAAKIPVRPAAYGKPVSEAVHQFPFRADNLDTLLGMADRVQGMSDKLARQNPVRRGEFVKGNKTKQEFNDVMENANGEDQLRALSLEANLFTPLKEILKTNILQYQSATEMLSTSRETIVPIDPTQLRKVVMEFKLSDGLLPSSKVISLDAMREGFQTLANVPGLAQAYNLAPLFSYMMKVQGAKLQPFEKPPEQVAYEQAVAQWQQMVMQILKDNPALPPTSLPAQPLPEQFGWNPQQQTQPTQPQPEGAPNGSTTPEP